MANNMSMYSPVKVYALGGLGEVGKNTYCIEDDSNLIIIDAGVMFPEADVLGISYVIPDYTHLKENSNKIRGLFITHGHEDHIGGIPFLVQTVNIPVIYAPKLACALIKHKLEDNGIKEKIKIVEYDENSIITLNQSLKVSFFHVTHSIPDSYGICVDTAQGRIVTTGDFKIDLTPIDSDISLSKIAKIGSEGVDLLLSDSTNAEKEGYTPSEKSVTKSINDVFNKTTGRIIVSTFSSNISRIQQIVTSAVAHKRKVAVVGRSMDLVINIARDYGYIKISDKDFIPVEAIKSYKNHEICILCTGSQGEPLAALSRIAHNDHPSVKLIPGDTVVFSSSAIPGNTASINRLVNLLTRKGANVLLNSPSLSLHASGHPSKQEERLMLKLFNPKYFMPVHGEYRMLKLHAELATTLGIPKENTFICGNGDTLELFNHKVTEGKRIFTDDVYIDGTDITGLSTAVIKDRKIISDNGIVSVYIGMDSKKNALLFTPQIESAGFMIDSPRRNEIYEAACNLLEDELNKALASHTNFATLKNITRATISQYLFIRTHRSPMVIPVVMNRL